MTVNGTTLSPARPEAMPEATPEPWSFEPQYGLMKPRPPLRWLVEGLWPVGSHGALTGPAKTLKSYLALMVAVGLASGRTIGGRWAVPKARPVVLFVGREQGGMNPLIRRLQRIVKTYGLSVEDLGWLPLRVCEVAGPLDGPEFRATVELVKAELQPGLIVIDALFRCPPGFLAELSRMVGPRIALLLTHPDVPGAPVLDGWADTWVNVKHVKRPTPAETEVGDYELDYRIGSRRTVERTWRADWSVGEFEPETGKFIGPLTFDVAPWTGPRGPWDPAHGGHHAQPKRVTNLTTYPNGESA